MKKITLVAIATCIAVSNISCGQSVSPQKEAEIAKNFSKGKEKGSLSKYSQATFAAGCFWHEETLFESIKGVKEVVSGYCGGTTTNPSYEEIETGTTGHAETVNIYYDSSKISYADLLKIYFEAMEDPTQVDGQGPDHGTQYRSAIFYRNDKEKQMAVQMIKQLDASHKYSKPLAAKIVPYTKFWDAEGYHQDYINTHTDNPYCPLPGQAP
jgi:peptide-methionine (S)-S-oxide reductase